MAITFDKSTKTFYLDGKNTTYAFYINNVGYAEHLYYGKRIGHDFLLYTRAHSFGSAEASHPGGDKTPGISSYNRMGSEISFFGTGDYREPCVMVKNPEGDRLTELLYCGYDILEEKPRITGMPSMSGGQTLVLHLYDEVASFGADLYYTVYDDCDVIARRIVYKNDSADKKLLLRAYSFTMTLPGDGYDALTLYGGWAKERNVERTPLHHGVFSIDSKRAASSAVLNPFLAIMERRACEDFGEVYGISLVYSSSYVLKAEQTNDMGVLITGGINDADFSWQLYSGEEFETPEVLIAYSAEGIGGMSRELHDAMRNHLICKRFVRHSRPLLINNWEATYFNFDNEKLMAIADAVDGTGIDTLVLDDGWFGKREDDSSGLGDWVVNERKLQGGLKRIIDHVHSKGMKFGLWFEPEMINEDSDIFRAHPDYAIGAPDRERCYSRHQFVMDLTRDDVRDYIVNSVNKILDENEIDYVKWDFNRNITEFFSFGRVPMLQPEFAHRYALGLYDICERIIEAHPSVFFEGCAGGGARFDPAMLYYFPQIWTSDDTDASERTLIQYGTSIAYPLSAMSCHVSAVPNHQVNRITPMKTRADIAHLGATGYELDTTLFTDEDISAVCEQVKEYKRIESLILDGDLYRIDSPFEGNYFAEAIVSKDKKFAHLICYRNLNRMNDGVYRVKMKGLNPSKKYFIPEMNMILQGSTLMSVGIVPEFDCGDFVTVTYHFEEK